MAQEAELKIDSSSIVMSTKAVDALYDSLVQLSAGATGVETSNDGLVASEKRKATALANANIASQKAIALLSLEQKGLDKTSQEYAELKAAILAKEVAAKKGIETSSKEYKILKNNITAKEKATAATKKLAIAQKLSQVQTTNTSSSFKSFTDRLDQSTKQVQLIDGPLGGIASRMTALSSIVKSGALVYAGLAVGVGLAVRELYKGVEVAAASEVAMKSFEAQLIATGGASGFTALELDNLARSLALNTLDSTEDMRKLVIVMGNFKNVTGDAFTTAIGLSQDLGKAMQQDPVTAARTLGKVLENPLKNYKQLARAGIEFSDTQADEIKRLQVTGELYKAQTIVTEELSKKFGGVAKAQADTLSGDVDTFNQKWEETGEILGKKLIPAFRSITKISGNAIELLGDFLESDVDGTVNDWAESFNTGKKGSEELAKELSRVQEEIENLSNSSDLKKIGGLINEYLESRGITILPASYLDQLEAWRIVEENLKNSIAARAKQAEAKIENSEHTKYIKEAQEKLDLEEKLTELFLKYGDTRSEGYRTEKAAIEASVTAKKLLVDGDDKEVKNIERLNKALSDATEARVRHNSEIQRSKAILSKSGDLDKQIELQKLIATGLNTTSKEYLTLSANIDAKNAATKSNISLSSEEFKVIEEQRLSLVSQQVELGKLKALQSETKTFKNVKSQLEKEISLNGLVRSGLSETSSEYIKEEALIGARNAALKAGFAIGSQESEQLKQQALDLAELRIQAQKATDFTDAGFITSNIGEVLIAGTREALAATDGELKGKLQDLLTSGDIDQSAFDERIKILQETIRERLKTDLIPLGLTIDEEGNQILLESVEAVEAERTEKLRELDLARKDNQISDEATFLERRNQIMAEYDQAAADQREDTFEKSASNMSSLRAIDTADNIASGLENLSAVAGNNRKLAKLSKTAAIFSASVSFVNGLSNANDLEYPLNIPAYAKAFLQGTELVQQANSLNEPSFAFGGVDISGAGTARSDSIKANIANGESVITATATTRHKDTLRRMNAGLPIDSGGSKKFSLSNSIVIQGDASEKTVSLIEEKLRSFEDRVERISSGVALQTIQEEQQVGGLFDPIS